MSILNDLFQQILHSEEKIRERFSKLRSTNNEIQAAQMRIRDAQDELKSLQGSLVLKTQRLAEEEQKVKWLRVRENVLTEKKKELKDKNQQLELELKNAKESSESERMTFTSTVCEFLSCHDLSGKGKTKREEDVRHKVQQLYTQETQLKQELEDLKARQEELLALRKHKDQLVQAETKLNEEHQGLVNALNCEKEVAMILDAEKQQTTRKPQNDPEFRRLGAELEAAKDGSMEGICEALAQELKELQQIHLKRELQRQKQLRQKQQQGKGEACKTSYQNCGRTWRYQLNKKN